MIALLAIAALSVDASYMYEVRNRLHAAADAAAKSGAIELKRNPAISQASLEAFADQQVTAHGFVSSRLGGTTTVVINKPPLSGPFVSDPNYVEAIVSAPTSTFFARILGLISMTPGARAVAGTSNPFSCLIVNDDLHIGNTLITLNGCGASVGRNLYGDNPNAEINGAPPPSVGVTGTCIDTCGAMGNLSTGAPPPRDPLAGLALPTDPGGCVPGTAVSLAPGCYTSISTTVTTLQAGIFYVKGTIDISNLSGTGVMIFVAPGGHITSANNNELHLSAPTSGPYKGIAIFQDPSNANNFDTGNSFTLDVSGAIYMPGTDVDIANHLTFTGTNCTLFIAKSLNIRNGSGNLTNSGCAATFGGALYLAVTIAQ